MKSALQALTAGLWGEPPPAETGLQEESARGGPVESQGRGRGVGHRRVSEPLAVQNNISPPGPDGFLCPEGFLGDSGEDVSTSCG